MNSEKLLRQTIERAQQIHAMQDSAYEILLKQIAEQISYLQQFGVTSYRVFIPNFVNRIPIQQTKMKERIIYKLEGIGYKIEDSEKDINKFIVSWNFI